MANRRTLSVNRKITSEEVPQEVVKENPRPRRSPLDGNFRDRLTVKDKDPNFVYRWVIDTDQSGHRIFNMKERGYELVTSSSVGDVGEEAANINNPTQGSIVRVPANKAGPDRGAEWHYLMRIHKDHYKEDQDIKQKQINEMDMQIHTAKHVQGEEQYIAKVDGEDSYRESKLEMTP